MTVPEFAIFQNSRTRQTAIWTKTAGKWTDIPKEDYAHIGLLAKLIRTDPNPVEIVKAVCKQNNL